MRVCFTDRIRDRYTAWVRMFNNHTGRIIEHVHALNGGVGIRHIVVRKCLTLVLLQRRNGPRRRIFLGVKRRLLMRIFSVSHRIAQFEF